MSNFNSWAPPPATFTPQLQWNHNEWNKLGTDDYVSTREIREAFLECLGIWPLLNEKYGVPKLLDRANFIKYCYYTEIRKDLQTDDHPKEYVPISYEKDEELRKEWRDRQLTQRLNLTQQYWDNGMFGRLDFMLPDEEKKAKKAKPNIKSKKNQYYIKAVKACRPDGIQALFDNGTEKLCPNCLEVSEGGSRKMRKGVVAHAIYNLYGNSKTPENHRSRAIECLRLVCSLAGVDVNADTWYTPANVGPPLIVAVKEYDTEVVRILLEYRCSSNISRRDSS